MSRKPQKSAMLIAHRIVRDIVTQGIGVGERLPSERVMLDSYEIGRASLREALRLLEYQGVIRLKPGPGGGPVLQDPDAAHFGDSLTLLLHLRGERFRSILEVRSALEPMNCRLAADRVREQDLAVLDGTIVAMETHLDDQDRFFEANKSFHDTIAWSSGNAVFGYLIDSMLGIIDGTVVGLTYTVGRRLAIIEAHKSIVESLRSRDPERSEERMRSHIAEYEEYVRRKYPEVVELAIEWEHMS